MENFLSSLKNRRKIFPAGRSAGSCPAGWGTRWSGKVGDFYWEGLDFKHEGGSLKNPADFISTASCEIVRRAVGGLEAGRRVMVAGRLTAGAGGA